MKKLFFISLMVIHGWSANCTIKPVENGSIAQSEGVCHTIADNIIFKSILNEAMASGSVKAIKAIQSIANDDSKMVEIGLISRKCYNQCMESALRKLDSKSKKKTY